MLVKVAPQNVVGTTLAQNLSTCECICEVEQVPECDHEVVGDIPYTDGFMQSRHNGRIFGEYLSVSTIKEIDTLLEGIPQEFLQRLYESNLCRHLNIETMREIKSLREVLTDDEILDVDTLKELRLTARLKQMEQQGVERDLLLFEILTNGGA